MGHIIFVCICAHNCSHGRFCGQAHWSNAYQRPLVFCGHWPHMQPRASCWSARLMQFTTQQMQNQCKMTTSWSAQVFAQQNTQDIRIHFILMPSPAMTWQLMQDLFHTSSLSPTMSIVMHPGQIAMAPLMWLVVFLLTGLSLQRSGWGSLAILPSCVKLSQWWSAPISVAHLLCIWTFCPQMARFLVTWLP